jgi:hypothetical protein
MPELARHKDKNYPTIEPFVEQRVAPASPVPRVRTVPDSQSGR